MLGIRTRPGLAELLAGDCELRDAVRRFKSTRLAVIPAGPGARGAHPVARAAPG